MKSHTQYIWFNTKNRYDIINITPQVEEALAKSGVRVPMFRFGIMKIMKIGEHVRAREER